MMLKEMSLWTQKLNEGLQLADVFYERNGLKLPKNIKKIAFVGMGGSGVAGRIFKTFLDRKGVVSLVIDSPIVPATLDTSTLAIVVSASGKTWETLSILDECTSKFIPTIVLAGGGDAIERAEKKGLPFVLLPKSLEPRSALGHFLGFLGGLFDAMGLLPGRAMVGGWMKESEKYIPTFVEAATFKNFLDAVNSSEVFHVWGIGGDSASVAYRAKTQFNENSKVQAMYSEFPELCHNLTVGFEVFKQNPVVVFFYSDFLPTNMILGIQAFGEILKEKRVVLYKPPVFGDTFENQLFNMILWSDFASYFLGKARGVTIEKVQIIEELKKQQKLKGIK